jgi:hypothetical protein
MLYSKSWREENVARGSRDHTIRKEMAEIKSTLDLVMERTRHLTLSEEEKREQALGEFKRNVSGLIQKFQDGFLTPDSFRVDLHRLQESSQVMDNGIIFEEITRRLDLDGDNSPLIQLLAGTCGAEPEGLTAILAAYMEALEDLTGNRLDQAKRGLERERGISGTAVLPNLSADPGWIADQQRLRDRFEAILRQELAKLKSALPSHQI